MSTILAPPHVIPPPSSAELSAALSAITIFLSLRLTVVELIIVCVPSTCKLPSILTVPVLSPTVAGSIINSAGPLTWLNVTLSVVATGCPIAITPVDES